MSEPRPTDIIRTYSFYAPFYDALFGAVLAPGRRKMAAAVSRIAPGRILEVGIGTGLTLPDYPPSAAITGVDLSPEMLEHARRVASGLPGRQVRLHIMDAEALAFPDQSFDCVTAPYVLSVTPDPDRLISELRRVCTKDGHIVILNHFSGSRTWRLLEGMFSSLANRIGFRAEFNYDEHIRKHDWEIVSSVPANIFSLSRLIILKNG